MQPETRLKNKLYNTYNWKRYVFIWLVILLSLQAFAQINSDTLHKKTDSAATASSFLKASTTGKLKPHFRYFFMATNNSVGLTDFYTNAASVEINYKSGNYRGFEWGMSASVVFNLGSSDFTKPDARTNQMNRYEIGLFDITDASRKKPMARWEELYLKYKWRKSQVTIGRQLLNSVFLNPQDGRMRPTLVGGVYAEWNEMRQLKLEGGYIYELSPRSTNKWYSVRNSIGINPVGVNPDGSKSGYNGSLRSGGIVLLGGKWEVSKAWSVKLHEQFVDKIFNSALVELEYTHKMPKNNIVHGGLQFIRQDALKEGGNSDPSNTYITKGARAFTFGARFAWEDEHWQTSLNYNRVSADGRYLMPREWGRDPFYTFLPRERNDGLGNVHAFVMKAGYHFSKAKLKTQLGIGYFDLPPVTDFTLNKYGLPSYAQLNIDIKYAFGGVLKKLEAQILFVYKSNRGNTMGNDKYIFNKVGMSQWNFVMNYRL